MVIRILILLCFGLLSFNSLAANISVGIDRDPVSIDESFVITFEADDHISDDPDFSPLQQDFEILTRKQSESMKFARGEYSKKTRWNLHAVAKRSGKLIIPSISFGNDNSPIVSITVNKNNSSSSNNDVTENRDMFIEVDAKLDTAYVQQQIIYSIRFYRAVNINAASMSEPDINGGEVVIEKLGDDSSFETHRNGRRYVVIERNYALFPQQSGDITIEPITLDAQIPNSSRGVFDPFGQNSSSKRIKSGSITLKIKPIPVDMRNQAWLPASNLKITENWSQQPAEFIVGEPITRTLTLKAEGLTAAQLPSLAMADTQEFKSYPDQPRLNDKRGSRGINGTRQDKIALIPTQAGQLNLPEININWWNVNSNKMETATLPARSVQVQPGAYTAPTTASMAMPNPAAVAQETNTAATETTTVVKEENGIYSKLSILLGLGWLITIVAWTISKRNHKSDTAKPTSMQQPKASLNAVKRACLDNNPQQSKTELLNWARNHWSENPPASIGEVGTRLNEATQQEIGKLNQALYGSASESWQGDQLWQHIAVAAKATSKKPRKEKEVLVPLYP